MRTGIQSSSRWHKACHASLRNRVVLRYLGPDNMMPFVIHRQIESEDDETFFEWGTYYNSLTEAETRFYERASEFEKLYEHFLELA